MGIATTIVLVLNVLALAAVIYMGYKYQETLHRWVSAAISDEIRRQDDRIQKRLERMDGSSRDAIATDSDGRRMEVDYRVGQPMRRGRDGS